MTDMTELDIGVRVDFHPYREKQVFGAFVDIPRNSETGKELEKLLIEASGRSYGDNHCCYTIHPGSHDKACSPPLHVWVSDSMLRIGTRLEDDPIK